MGDVKRVGYLYDKEEDHTDEPLRYELLYVTEIGLLDLSVHILIALTVLTHLQVQEIVLEDLVAGDDMGCLWHQVDPFVHDAVHLEISGVLGATEELD